MEPPGGRDSRFNLGYSMNLLSGETPPEIYGGSLGRPSTSLQQLSPRHTMVSSACGTRGGIKSDVCYDDRGMPPQQGMGMEACGVNDISDEPYNSLQSKKSPPSNGKKTKGRVKIKMEYIENKLRRYTTFSKRKTGIMKKAYELSTLTGTQVMLLVASETGHVYTFATRKLQPMITSEAGKALIQTCLNSPDPPVGASGGDQRMSATGFEETELTYNISDEDSKENEIDSSISECEEMSEDDDSELPEKVFVPSDPPLFPPKITEKVLTNEDSSISSSSESDVKHGEESKSKVSSSKYPKAPNTDDHEDQSPIISQIKEINNALILSNKAAASAAVTPSPIVPPLPLVQPPTQSGTPSPPIVAQQPATQLPDNVKAVPILVQTPSGVGFASVSEGMILGMIQGSNEPKLIAMPISSIAPSGSGVTMAVNKDNMR